MEFEKLNVWKRSTVLSSDIYIFFRSCKDYGYKDQITRSGLSVPSNIAEGMERDSRKEQIRFLVIAKSSCAELRTQVYIGINIGYIDQKTGYRWKAETLAVSKMIKGLIGSIEKKSERKLRPKKMSEDLRRE